MNVLDSMISHGLALLLSSAAEIFMLLRVSVLGISVESLVMFIVVSVISLGMVWLVSPSGRGYQVVALLVTGRSLGPPLQVCIRPLIIVPPYRDSSSVSSHCLDILRRFWAVLADPAKID